MEYRYKNDKNQTIDDDYEKAILNELPIEVRTKLMVDFLFKEFLTTFSEVFKIPNKDETVKMNKKINEAVTRS